MKSGQNDSLSKRGGRHFERHVQWEGGVLKLDAPAGFDASIEVMFYLTHLGDNVGEFDEFGGGVPSGEDEFDVGGAVLNEVNRALQGNEIAVDAVVDFIDNHEVVLG